MSLVLNNAQIALPTGDITGSVTVENGAIADISEDPRLNVTGFEHHDFNGDYLIPGLVELHTDQIETHYQPRPKRFWDPIPAVLAHDAQMAASGITTVFDAIRIGTGPTDGNSMARSAHKLIEAVEHAAGADLLRAEHFIHLRCEVSTADVVDMFDQLADHELIRLVSLMDHTPGQRQYENIEAFKTYMLGKGRLTEGEFDEHVQKLYALAEKYSDLNRKLLAERANAKNLTKAAHDDATSAHADESASLNVAISEFPTTVEAAHAARGHGQQVLMGAPNIVRGGSHSGNVAAIDLLHEGLLNILSSDYVPASPLQAMFALVAQGHLSVSEASALVSSNPARAVGLEDRGVIAPGYRADVVRVHVHTGTPETHQPAHLPIPVVRSVWRSGKRVV
ncbi:alpha-D-ribose 1-methylphosphonate 5-triphosphate diphosphatase [Brevibacterium sp. ACRRH]|uniref:alpha-D-ribose 1-methylphosphonate 5-triphosphate diphosphatase n=1 Tax=Brevibacterium sp. ACRRH TaxID=2918183 RepID=UPI001EF5E078|nr:alpha-D-ribose 1-methylphosphonate 5-triphosphate diphosphatase [Brevibacterium sp. ACRRH]MCG7298909.1 alpha-D-ribose 1-methylphosphonate 5-triphosphate diphosphatase [Brevibacterium sp. ACRRH]